MQWRSRSAAGWKPVWMRGRNPSHPGRAMEVKTQDAGQRRKPATATVDNGTQPMAGHTAAAPRVAGL
eukprot:170214-Chlamydomonas_euryale.AAC.1